MQKSKKIDDILSADVDMENINRIIREFEMIPIDLNHMNSKKEISRSIQYASILMKSNNSHKLKSIQIFQTILNKQDDSLFRLELEDLSYVLYQLALVYYSMNKYEESRKCCEELIGINPDDDRQIKDLLEAVVYKHKQDLELKRKKNVQEQQNIGVAVGVVTAIVAIAAFALTKGRKK